MTPKIRDKSKRISLSEFRDIPPAQPLWRIEDRRRWGGGGVAHGDCERRSRSPARAERESPRSGETERESPGSGETWEREPRVRRDLRERAQGPARLERESPGSGETERELSDGDGGWGRTTVGVEEAHARHGSGSSGSGSSGLSGLAVRAGRAAVVGGRWSTGRWSVVTHGTGPSLQPVRVCLDSLVSLELSLDSGQFRRKRVKKIEKWGRAEEERVVGSRGVTGSGGLKNGSDGYPSDPTSSRVNPLDPPLTGSGGSTRQTRRVDPPDTNFRGS